MVAPVVGSGSCPTWIARVENFMRRMIPIARGMGSFPWHGFSTRVDHPQRRHGLKTRATGNSAGGACRRAPLRVPEVHQVDARQKALGLAVARDDDAAVA